MTARLRELKRLEPVLQAAFDAERQKMAALADRINRLIALRDGMNQPVPTADLALFTSGADLRWSTWSQARRKELSIRLSRLMADRERARAGLSRAFGRLEAVRALIMQEERSERQRRQRQV